VKILIVDDNPRVRQVIRTIVGDIAQYVYECEDGNKALEAYEEFRPDWVLMDIGMKDLDGFSATEQIKRAHPEARVLIVTDYSDVLFKKSAMDAGAYALVPKENMFEIAQVISRFQQTAS